MIRDSNCCWMTIYTEFMSFASWREPKGCSTRHLCFDQREVPTTSNGAAPCRIEMRVVRRFAPT